ncbi:uncharacterized protein LOC124550437 [Schistocerca americana]|uniref:uncharacterized protein LOC124550437 n=1 Tax=Schistocerca americana TaxID=7009 RepID=UPI001F4FC6BA|nr:uncharacterized protein LOC124550437 [Schistocerca americana]
MAACLTQRVVLLAAICALLISLSAAIDYHGPLLSKLAAAEQLGEGAPRAPRAAFGPPYGGGFGGGRHHPGFGGGFHQPGCVLCGGGRPGGISGSFSKSSSSSSSGSINFGRKK